MGENKLHRTVIAVAVIMSIAFVISALSASYLFFKSRNPDAGNIYVTGSAKREIKSDFVVWRCRYSVQTQTLPEAYSTLKSNQQTVKDYLIEKGIPSQELSVMAVDTEIIYATNPNGMMTNVIEGYRLLQSIEVQSNDVDKINAISKEATELIDKGILMVSQQPQFYYTKIADLKIEMLALATKDAKDRAEKVAENSGAKITGMLSSNMGVFQITALYSNEISDYGINDTTSINKEIMAVMNCRFKTK
ncbi:MAG: SIMPL domain-containing protein [Clostridiaceae bacterium]|nr:SIMPL domain-containing protein [Clostridiaceae bacterium]